MKIVIIEDEKLTAKDLANTIRVIEPDVEILPFLYSVEDAIMFFQQKPDVDLIFSDIELGDGLSFDIFEKTDVQLPIIFCTAYHHYYMEAFQTYGIDYILKPFNILAVEKTLIKYKNLKNIFANSDKEIKTLFTSLKTAQHSLNPSVIVHHNDKVIPLNGSDIAFFLIENDCTFAYTFAQKKYLVNQKLEKLEQTFVSFFRANRQYLINRKAVKDASQYFNRKMFVNLTIAYPGQIIIGKLKTTEFVNWLKDN